MKFLYPGFLWALLALAIPIIIHLFNFRRYKTLYFSSLQFVKRVDEETKSTQRLKHILVLIARCLAFIFLVLAFAQPYIDRGSTAEKDKDQVIALFIDNSFSMQARGVEGELLSEARESARSLIARAPQGTQFILGTNEMSGVEQRRLSKIDALEKLDQIDYSPLTRSIEEIITWQNEAVNKEKADGKSAYVQSVVLSDFQDSKSGEFESLKSFGSFNPVQLVPEKTNNLVVDSVWFESPIRKSGRTNQLNIRVKNFGENDLQNVEIVVEVDRFKKNFYVDVPANGSTNTSISYMDKTDGFKRGFVRVLDEHVLFDDTYHLSYKVRSDASILVINGEDAIENVGIVLGLEEYYQVQEVDITSVTLDDLKGQDLAILNGANSLSSGFRTTLSEFYSAGGSLLLFPGKNASRSEWNALLAKTGLPGLGQTVTSGTKIDRLNVSDPFISGVIDAKSERLNLPSVSKAYQPVVNSNSQQRPLVVMQNGLSLFSYSSGSANAYLFYSSIHPDWGNISKDALFSTLVLRTAELSQRAQPIALTIGDQSKYPLFMEQNDEGAVHLISEDFDFIPQTSEVSGVRYISLNQLDRFEALKANTYSIESEDKLGDLSINYSRDESMLKYLTEQDILDRFKRMGQENVAFQQMDGVNSPLSNIEIDKPFSYWKICIILTLIFVATEMLLIRLLKQ